MMERKILSVRDPNWLESRGRIVYDPKRPNMKNRTKYWAIVDVDREITRYFRWWVDRELLNITGVEGFGLKQPSWDAHISIIRGENDVRQVPRDMLRELWGKYQGQEVTFRYSLNVRQSGDTTGWDRPDHYWFVNVESPELIDIRKELGLPYNWSLHLTIGRTYW